MTTFNDREKAIETKFAHDEELNFKANARRNKLLGLWAADKLGKTGAEAEQYAKDVVVADFEEPGDDDVVDKLVKDFANGGVALSRADVEQQMQHLLPIAREQILGEKK